MLLATTVVVTLLAPIVSGTIRETKQIAATTTMTVIAQQLNTAIAELNYFSFTIDGVKTGTRVRLLVSDGDIPREVSATGSASWQGAVDNASGLVDFLERHLVTNNPRGSALNAYTTTAPNYWRGAYLTSPIDPDPWGNRYVVNAQWFTGPAGGEDVVVFSAGADEQIDSPYAADGLTPVDDDLMVLVEP